MNKHLYNALVGLLLVSGLALLYLTNKGVVSFDRPAIYQLSEALPAASKVVAFVEVAVVPMDSERILVDHTVVVRDGAIEAMGPSDEMGLPEGALVVDGRGRYLMPGLVDMHVHVEYENDLLLPVANGVTGVRNLWGNSGKKLWFGLPDQLALRRLVEAGELLGPTLYTAGPVMEGSPAFHPLAETFDSPAAARESVAWQAEQGYDFVKVYDHLSPKVYQAIIEAAQEVGLPVVGHVPFAVGLEGVLDSGQQTIEHMLGYIDPDAAEFAIPEDQLDAYAVKTQQAGVWNCVTMSEYPKTIETAVGFQRLQEQPHMVYVSPGMRFLSPFLYMMASKSHTYQGDDYPTRMEDLNRRMVQALHRAGAGLLLGTDAAQAYHLPGFSVHEELAFMVEAGLSPYEALATGTTNAAAALGKLDQFGTVESGKRADLILLEANPLENVAHVQQRAGVMERGRWMTEEQLQGLLGSLVESYRPRLIERIWPLVLIGAAAWLIWRRLGGS